MFHFLIFCDILLYLFSVVFFLLFFFFFKQKTAYEMRISDWSSDVCSSDLLYDGDNVVVRFTHEMSQRPGRAALAKYQDGDELVGKLVCAPPVLTQPGAYRVEVALDGASFLHAGWIQFYQPVQLTGCSPAIIDASNADEHQVAEIRFQCDQPIDQSLEDDEINVRLQSEE